MGTNELTIGLDLDNFHCEIVILIVISTAFALLAARPRDLQLNDINRTHSKT